MKYPEIERELEARRDSDPRDAAEYAYALARMHQEDGDPESATRFGRDAIALFGQCDTSTMEACSARNVQIGRICIPDLIHEDVVRDRLKPLEL
ncbi:MAG: hypothetical protein PHI63_05600 [Patescibacteria group bacterium]|nr:hypothetical protein [Patescibacteria group bacterium]